jgi:hypothetical protein
MAIRRAMRYACSSFQIQQQVFPYPPYHRTKGFDDFIAQAFPLLLVIGFIFIVPSITIKVASERETGIKVLSSRHIMPR